MDTRQDVLSGELVRSILDHEPVALALYRPAEGSGDFVHAYVNDAFQALRPGVPMAGRTCTETWPEIGHVLVRVLGEVARTGEPWTEREIRLPIEPSEGGIEARYLTFRIVRLEPDAETWLLAAAIDTTSEVDARLRGESRLERVLDTVPEGLIVVDPEGAALQWNPAALRMHGYDEQEDELSFLSRAAEIYDFFTLDGEPVPLHDWPVPRLLRGEEFENLQLVLRHKHDEWQRIFSYFGAHIPSEDGQRLLGLLSIRDETESTREEREREELLHRIDRERTQLETVLGSLAEGVIVSDADAKVLHMNAEALRMHGFEDLEQARRQLGQSREFELRTLDGAEIPVEDWPLGRVQGGERFSDYVVKVRNVRTGETATWNYSGAPVMENGRLLLTVLTVRDVTRRRRDAEVLEFRSVLLASVSDSVIVYWRDEPDRGRLLYVNPAAYEKRGYAPDEILRLTAADMIAPEWRPRLEGWLRELDERGETSFESYHVRKDGSIFPIEARLRLIEYAGRRVVVNTSRDVSERKETEERLHRELETTRLLLEAARALGSGGALAEVTQALAEVAVRTSGHGRATVFLSEPARGGLLLAAEAGTGRGPIGRLFPLGDMSAELRALLERGGSAVIDYGEGAAGSGPSAEAAMVRALVVTVGSPPEVAGFVAVDDPQEAGEFLPHEIDLLSGIASQAFVAIENARLLEAEREARTAWAALARLGTLLTTAADVRDAMPEVLRRVCETIGSNGAVLSERVGRGWRTTATYGVAEGVAEYYTDEESPARAELARTREPYFVSDVAGTTDYNRRLSEELGFHSYFVYPLLFRDRVIGSLSLLFPEPNPALSETLREFVRRCVFTISTAQDSARLFDDLRESRDLSEALNRIDSAISSTLDFDEIMDRVVEEAARAVDADSAVIYLREEDGWTARYVFALPRDLIGRRFTAEEIEYSDISRERGSAIVINDPLADPRVNDELVRRYGITSIMDVALRVGEDILGDFSLHYHSPDKHFSEAHADFADKVAASVTLAVRNAEAYSSERNIADTLQKALLTLPDHIHGIRMGHLYRSATKTAEVGGDFYDVFEMDDDRVGVLLGDVSGKGIAAAATTALAKNTIRAYAYETPAPAEVVRKANAIVVRATAASSFITLFFGVLDCRTETLRYCNAGHPPAVVRRSGGGVEWLAAESPLVGAFPGLDFTEDEIHLPREDVLLLYTDGAIEARSGNELYGDERLFATIARLPADVRILPEEIFADILRFTGGTLSDDLALLAVAMTRGGA